MKSEAYQEGSEAPLVGLIWMRFPLLKQTIQRKSCRIRILDGHTARLTTK
jgi:hypothetical protein